MTFGTLRSKYEDRIRWTRDLLGKIPLGEGRQRRLELSDCNAWSNLWGEEKEEGSLGRKSFRPHCGFKKLLAKLMESF